MRSTLLFCLFVIFSVALTAQKDVRQLKSFNAVNVSGSIQVELRKGNPQAEIEMKKGDIEDLVVEVKGDRLKIYFKDKKMWGNDNRSANIILSYDEAIENIDVSAGSSIECKNVINSSSLKVEASSGARAEVMVDTKNMDVNVSSGASVSAEGETKFLDVDASSGASFRGSDLKAEEVDAEASSGASVKVWATQSIEAGASSGGSVKYKGDPSKTNIDVGKWSGGSVNKL